MLFRKKIERRCQYCARCAKLGQDTALCTKKGVVLLDGSCRRFRYDPLKRKPKQPVELPQFDASDFEL